MAEYAALVLTQFARRRASRSRSRSPLLEHVVPPLSSHRSETGCIRRGDGKIHVVEKKGPEEFMAVLASAAEQFSSDKRVYRILFRALAAAKGGSMIIYAPTEDLMTLNCDYCDRGYMERLAERNDLQCVVESQKAFHMLVGQLSEHMDGDEWMTDDGQKTGISKDGAWCISPSGKLRNAGVKISSDWSKFHWDVGTRRSTGLGVAAKLSQGLVLVRSESGTLLLITASSAQDGHVFTMTGAEAEECARQLQRELEESPLSPRLQKAAPSDAGCIAREQSTLAGSSLPGQRTLGGRSLCSAHGTTGGRTPGPSFLQTSRPFAENEELEASTAEASRERKLRGPRWLRRSACIVGRCCVPTGTSES